MPLKGWRVVAGSAQLYKTQSHFPPFLSLAPQKKSNMEPTPTPTTTTTTTAAATSQQGEPRPPPQQQQLSQPPLSSTTPNPLPSSPNPKPNPNSTTATTVPPSPKPVTLQPIQSQQQSQQSLSNPRPGTPAPTTSFSRTWQQNSHSHFSQFSSAPPGPSLSSPASSSVSAPPPPRGGMAIGVPASHPSPSPSQPPPFSGSFGQQFGSLGRGGVNVPESVSNSSNSQVRPGMPVMGITGSMGSSSQIRPGGISTHHQPRPTQTPQSSLRPPSSPSNQPATAQNFQGSAMLRVPSAGSPVSPAPSTSQSMQSGSSLNQPWLSSGSQGKPPLPPPSYRAQTSSPSMQQRSHVPQQHQSSPTTSQQQHISSPQPQEHHVPPSRSITHQLQMQKGQVSGNQKPSSLAVVQPSTGQPGAQSKMTSPDTDESSNRILSKRSIHELVNQIDPSEKLDPEVEDVLVDIAEDFVDSITTFGCSLAKHRKSDTLEAKDILLHLERNWNMTLPGFGGDEIKTFRKPLTTDIHKERLAAIRKSIVATEALNTKNYAGHAAVTVKGNLAKTSGNFLGSPNIK